MTNRMLEWDVCHDYTWSRGNNIVGASIMVNELSYFALLTADMNSLSQIGLSYEVHFL